MSARAILDLLVPAWVASEILLGVLRRARAEGDRTADQGSSPLLWGVILASVACAVAVRSIGAESMPLAPPRSDRIALGLLAAGLLARWWAILTLGRLFTMTLAVRADHGVVTTGPYRWVRHPAYTGMLLAFAGCGLWMGSWLTLAVLVIPITGVVLHRIRVEEAALTEALGEEYRSYRERTKRLLPYLL